VRLRTDKVREVKVLLRGSLAPVTKGNCVARRRGGEQPEVNTQSAGNERDSAWRDGESAGD